MENSKQPIATPKITFLPKSRVVAIAKPIAGKNGSILISVMNINRDNLEIRKYSIAVLATILVVEFRNVGMLYCPIFIFSAIFKFFYSLFYSK